MIVKLEIYSPRLSGICYVEGIGLSSNVYTIGVDEITVIDTGAGDPMNTLPPKLKTLDLDPRNVKQIILTHTHFDHTGGIEALASMASPRLLLHEDGIKNDVEGFGLSVSKLHDGDSVSAEDRRLEVIHTPGHMPGAICLYERQDKILFSGDTAFPDGGFGRDRPSWRRKPQTSRIIGTSGHVGSRFHSTGTYGTSHIERQNASCGSI